MSSVPLSANHALSEYVGTDKLHIARIMARLSLVCPPLVYPPLGQPEDPRLPFQAGEWTLGSTTSPGGRQQADITDAATHGHYYVGAQWPDTDMAPQAALWVPPKFPEARYSAASDRQGYSRYTSTADRDNLYPEAPQVLTAESAQVTQGTISYARTGSIVSPWTVLVWGNDWEDTKLLAMWLASAAHDCERSQPERLGSQFTVTAGGWYEDKPGDRGMVWAMRVEIVEPIVRSEFNTTRVQSQAGKIKEDIAVTVRPTVGEGGNED